MTAQLTDNETIAGILAAHKIDYAIRDDDAVVFNLTGHERTYQFVCSLRVERQSFSLAVVGLLFLPSEAERARETMELLLHINFRTWVGHFERDAIDGEVRFRVEVPFGESKLQDWELLRAIVACGSAVDQNIALVTKVWDGSLSVAEAISRLNKGIERNASSR